jgi:hypothetical protein
MGASHAADITIDAGNLTIEPGGGAALDEQRMVILVSMGEKTEEKSDLSATICHISAS